MLYRMLYHIPQLHGAFDLETSTLPIFRDSKSFTFNPPSCAVR